jgi:hypothetical protein
MHLIAFDLHLVLLDQHLLALVVRFAQSLPVFVLGLYLRQTFVVQTAQVRWLTAVRRLVFAPLDLPVLSLQLWRLVVA